MVGRIPGMRPDRHVASGVNALRGLSTVLVFRTNV
jgi:hypothetical protein